MHLDFWSKEVSIQNQLKSSNRLIHDNCLNCSAIIRTLHKYGSMDTMYCARYNWNYWAFPMNIAIRSVPQGLIENNIGSGSGLVWSGNKPIPEPILTQIYVTIWCY